MIPDLSNPQSWNRFSYVINNPVRFSDPTGHKLVEDEFVSGSDDSGNSCDTDGNGYDDIPCPDRKKTRRGLLRGSSSTCPADFNLTECHYAQGILVMGQEPIDIEPSEFATLMLAIAHDLHGRSSTELKIIAPSYDTPFYDRKIFGQGGYPGKGCISGKCYTRDELNYVAQGILWAAAGISKKQGHEKVEEWKASPILHFPTTPSQGTIEMFDFGYDFYQNIYLPLYWSSSNP